MSINSAMLAGVSGLIANSSALAAISDNIANVNTTAYKRNQVDFATVVTAQTGAGRYSAGGVTGVSRQFVSQQGQVQAASSSTDLAVSGDGFFVVTQKASGLSTSDARLFTRAGAFTVDADGYLKNDAGLYLQGWPVNANGTFSVNPSDVNALSSINVKGLGTTVSPTSKVTINANLNSQGAVSPDMAFYDPTLTAKSMSGYADNGTGAKPDFTIDTNITDSLGATHKVTVGFIKDDTAANTWHAEVYAVPAADVAVDSTATPPVPPGQLAVGDVVFNPDGSLDTANTTLPLSLSLGDSAASTFPHWGAALGVDAQTVGFNIDNLSQLAQTSTVSTVNSDGAGVGNVVGVTVGTDGVVSAIFDNSQVRQIAKIALGEFPNPDGLKAVTGNAYQASLNAGGLVLKEPGIGAGSISPSSLEASTVDLSSEFTGLITTQKAYTASSKIITTADSMLSDLLNIIR
jgi:flagellar hook protein FlgE